MANTGVAGCASQRKQKGGERRGQVIAVNDEVLKPRSVTMPDGRDIKSIEYKIDIFAYEQKRKEESIVLKIIQDMSERLKAEGEAKSRE